jgi:hypothetical protein
MRLSTPRYGIEKLQLSWESNPGAAESKPSLLLIVLLFLLKYTNLINAVGWSVSHFYTKILQVQKLSLKLFLPQRREV